MWACLGALKVVFVLWGDVVAKVGLIYHTKHQPTQYEKTHFPWSLSWGNSGTDKMTRKSERTLLRREAKTKSDGNEVKLIQTKEDSLNGKRSDMCQNLLCGQL